MGAGSEPLLYRLAIALGIGLIVGIERGWKTRLEHGGQRRAGVRTFALAGLFGGVLAAVASDRPIVLAAGLVVIGTFVIAAYLAGLRESRDLGMTTEFALLTTFGLGAAAVLGAPFEATAAAIVMALVLGLKPEFHHAIEGLDRPELLATLQLLLIAAVLVPLLPARDMGPWQAVNPRTVGMLVLLIMGLSYVGYFAVRVLGSRLGVLLTAVLGGLTSSTAVTVAYARRSRASSSSRTLLGAGIALAAATMVPRLAVEIAAVNASILKALWPTFAALALLPVAGLVAFVFAPKAPAAAGAELKLDNPLQLKTALIFGLLLSALFIAAEGLARAYGDAGVYVVAGLAGFADVDAIGLTLARAAGGTLSPSTAARAIVVAMLVNTAVKAGLAAALGGLPMLRSASALLGVALAGGVIVAVTTLA
jgi:uncharacterized membrane protein (DUF4010 family)